jgi:50S ribosome-binding GTPase
VAATFSIETSTLAAGAIGIVRLAGDDLDATLAALGLPPAPPGAVVLADLLGIDRGLFARYTPTTADLMVHGGRGVVAAMADALTSRGIKEGASNHWPEAADAIEAAMLETLAHAASPRAIPALLAQPARHREAPTGPFADAAALAHLLTAPLVVITGAPNIGKSSLLNALVGRQAAIVADEPGTTRDAVAARVVLDGLAVRLIDAPGMVDRAAGSHPPLSDGRPPLGEGSPIEPDPLIRAATTIAQTLIASADLILVCRDAAAAEPAAATPPAIKGESLRAALAVATRCDLSPARPSTALAVSATTGEGLDALAAAIRTTLVPDATLADTRPWPLAAASG